MKNVFYTISGCIDRRCFGYRFPNKSFKVKSLNEFMFNEKFDSFNLRNDFLNSQHSSYIFRTNLTEMFGVYLKQSRGKKKLKFELMVAVENAFLLFKVASDNYCSTIGIIVCFFNL